MSLLLVMIGGAVGAPARFLVDRAVMRRRSGTMPWGTFAVNVIGSLLLGVLVGFLGSRPESAIGGVGSEHWRLLLGTGFCGALTTYSTFGFENARLLQEGRVAVALANIVGTLALTFAALACGFALGSGAGA